MTDTVDLAFFELRSDVTIERLGRMQTAVEKRSIPSLDGFSTGQGRFVSPNLSRSLLVVGWMLGWAAAFASFYRPVSCWRYALISAARVLLTFTVLAGFAHLGHGQAEHAVVATRNAILRQPTEDNFPAVLGQPLPEGLSLSVLRDRDAWRQVRTPDGQIGWVASVLLECMGPPVECRTPVGV